MATIEVGEFFTVTRGRLLGQPIQLFTALAPSFADVPAPPRDEYDRSYTNKIFYAAEICGPVIAAILIHPQPPTTGMLASLYERNHDGHVIIILNMEEVEVWPVTRRYLEAIGVSTTAPKITSQP